MLVFSAIVVATFLVASTTATLDLEQRRRKQRDAGARRESVVILRGGG
jgi:hypothetical protein